MTKLSKAQSEALDWFFDLREHPDRGCVSAGFQNWMRASKVHRDEFAAVERTWRLAGPLLEALEPAAGAAEREALLEAMQEELARCPNMFLDS